MKQSTLIIYALVLISLKASGQAIGINQRDALTPNGLVAQYENDFFGRTKYGNTDYYYSQGVSLMLTAPLLKRNPANYLLLKTWDGNTIYGLNVEHDAYTPTSILSDSILYGDRPYAASIMLQSFAISSNYAQHFRLTAALTIGLVGPGAGGEEIQATIHRNTGNNIPHGWQYQIANNVILNYSAILEKNLLDFNYITLDASAGADVGSYWNKGYAGFIVKAGLMNLPLINANTKNFQVYLKVQPRAAIVGYDATLQGGLFNRNSPYTIASPDISRFTLRNDVALYLSYRKLLVSGSYTALTKEFKSGKSHAWGGVTISIAF